MSKRLFVGANVYNTDVRAFEKADILTDGSKIVYVGALTDRMCADEIVDCTGEYIIPGLVDVHTHGRGGFDFNKASAENVRYMRDSYAAVGTTSFMATLASAPLESLYDSVEAIGENYATAPGTASVVGVHLEGRYLNSARRGAHAAELLATLDAAELGALLDAMHPMRAHVSAALELAEDDFYDAAKSRGATLGLAHSDATYSEAMEATKKGATSFTHTYNAMRPLHHREPGNIAAAMLSEAYSEIICDGEHVHPAMVEMLSRLKPQDKLVLITDSMEASGCEDGEYEIAGQKVYVRGGKAVNVDGALAGSTLNLFTALKNYMSFCSLTLEEALPCASANPADMVGATSVCGRIKEGLRADFIVLDSKENMNITAVYAAGERVGG